MPRDGRDFSHEEWTRAARWRRYALLALTLLPAALAAHVMHTLIPNRVGSFMTVLITLLFGVLFAWIAVGFWSALAGLAIMLRRHDRFDIAADAEIDPTAAPSRAAVLFPVYNEDARQVFARIRTVLRSIRDAGAEGGFDFFILSDSTSPDAWVREEEAWHRLCAEENAFERVFYRHRKINRKGKSGNLADFCRRWGNRYPYMIVFDADSLMAGKTLTRMVRIMDAHPEVGILQTAPKSANSRSLISRLQQFSNNLYGPVFAAGLHYWQLGDAQYWGHNAIIRIKPFMRHCHLPVLPGRSPLGGHILSHDFVEAALMRRAGYGVWLAHGLDGSYEENPPTLVDELARDRRWCQGNLQHSRLVFARGFFPTQRALFINGIMSYGSAMLWLFFLVASSCQAVMELVTVPSYFPNGPSLFPDWPKYFSGRPLWLFAATTALLFLPKALTIVLVVCRRASAGFGGAPAMLASAAAETAVSALLAPVRMLYHSLFVATTLIGFKVRWNTQNRGGDGTGWGQAIRRHWWGTLLGLVWGALMYIVDPAFFLWLSPIVAGLALSIPLSVWTSRSGIGKAAGRLGLFLTPPDINPDPELRALEDNLAQPEPSSPFAIAPEAGFTHAVVLPRVFRLHLAMNARNRALSPQKSEQLRHMAERAALLGPGGLTNAEKNFILREPACLTELHHRVWALDNAAAAKWGVAAGHDTAVRSPA